MTPQVSKTLKNHEVVLLAVYLLGGETSPIETEDLAVKVNELAPGAPFQFVPRDLGGHGDFANVSASATALSIALLLFTVS